MTQLEEQQTKLMQQRRQADLHAYVMVDGDSLTEQSSYHTEANSLLLASVEKQLGRWYRMLGLLMISNAYGICLQRLSR